MSNNICVKDGWDNPMSHICESGRDELGVTGFSGIFSLHSLSLPFSLNRQVSGKYAFRGTIRIVSPVDGFTMQVTGFQRKEVLEKLGDNHTDHPRELAIKAEIYCNSADLATVKAAIENAANRLFNRNIGTIFSVMKRSAKPELLTPAQAGFLYAKKFVNSTYRGVKAKTVEAKTTKLIKLFSSLPDIAMCTYSVNRIITWQKSTSCSKNDLSLMHKFWRWLLTNGYVIGRDPFPGEEKRQMSPQVLQAKSKVPTELDLSMQDKLFAYLQCVPASGAVCGLALMLWAGVSASYAVTLNWRDIAFFRDGNAIILLRKDENAGATHDRRRPVFPQAATILRRRYTELKEQYDESTLIGMPIVSRVKRLDQPLTANELIQSVGMILRQIGVSEETFRVLQEHGHSVSGRLLINSYARNINTRCGFGPDNPGIKAFMLGHSLVGDVTADNYTSFTSAEAVYRITTAMRAVAPENPVVIPPDSDSNSDLYYAPTTTRETVSLLGQIIVPPGTFFSILCPGGVQGDIDIRELKSDGTKRRASQNDKESAWNIAKGTSAGLFIKQA